MGAIVSMRAKGRKMSYPPHELIEKDGRRAYRRMEMGGVPRVLVVWSLETCRQKIADKQKSGQLKEFFASLGQLAGQYCGDNSDPIFKAWFTECFANCETAYMEATQPAIEEFGYFGVDEPLEEFGV